MRPVGGRASTLRPTVVEAQRGELLRWRGRVAIPGLLEADHSFVLEATSDSRTRLVQREHFRGLLVPFLSGALDRGTLPAFALMNEALKRRAEQPVGTPHG
jgi:hypothetical protein